MEENKFYKMGTIEPIYKEIDNGDKRDSIAFIRGAIEKYKDAPIDKNELLNYILKMINR